MSVDGFTRDTNPAFIHPLSRMTPKTITLDAPDGAIVSKRGSSGSTSTFKSSRGAALGGVFFLALLVGNQGRLRLLLDKRADDDDDEEPGVLFVDE